MEPFNIFSVRDISTAGMLPPMNFTLTIVGIADMAGVEWG